MDSLEGGQDKRAEAGSLHEAGYLSLHIVRSTRQRRVARRRVREVNTDRASAIASAMKPWRRDGGVPSSDQCQLTTRTWSFGGPGNRPCTWLMEP